MTRLFNPRIDIWEEHSSQDFLGSVNRLTDIGPTIVYVLDMNAPRRVELRAAIRAIEDADRKTQVYVSTIFVCDRIQAQRSFQLTN